jgi:hypothetical protein
MPGIIREDKYYLLASRDLRTVRPTLRILANFLSIMATLFATTPGLPVFAQTVLLDHACPCRSGGAHADDHHHHHHDGPCRPGCQCDQCRHRHATDPRQSGEDGSVLEGCNCPLCPFCPSGNCYRCCACQAPCCLPPPPATFSPAPGVSRLAVEAAPTFPPPLPGSLIRPPRA